MKEYFFTFGIGQPLEGCYTTVRASSMEEARQMMFEEYGSKWAFCYESAMAAGVHRFDLMYVPFGTRN